MSPSEDELRAALRHGEGEGVDVDGVVRHAAAVRRGRRVRIASVAAAVLVVAGVGAGAAVVSGRHTDHTPTAHSPLPVADQPNALTAPSTASGNLPDTTSGASAPPSQHDAVACPATQPEPVITKHPPGAERGPLLTTPLRSLTVCAYFADQRPVALNGVPVSTTLDGTQADAVAAGLDAAPTTRRTGEMCPDLIALSARTLVLYGFGADGTAQPLVIAPIDRPVACNPETTNGTAVRFNWIPSTALSAYLDRIRAIGPTPRGAANSGSPAN